MRAWLIVMLGLGATSIAVGEPLRAPTCAPPAENAKPPKSVRDVDWCNRDDLGTWKGPLREGHSEIHIYPDISQPHDTIAVSLRGVVYGDLDGDRRPEAVVVIENTTWIGSTGRSSGGTTAYVYGFAKGAPVRLGSIPTGTPVDAITIAKGVVTITSGPTNAKSTQSFRRDKDAFVNVTP